MNGTNDSQNSHQKYSQILGDHQTNNFTTQLSNKSTSSTTSSQNHTFKARSYNNKENYYNNQRSALRGGPKNGWHRSNSSISSNNYRTTAFSSKDNKRTDENGKSGSNGITDEGREPIKFNEGELKYFCIYLIYFFGSQLCCGEKFLLQLTLICMAREKRTTLCNNSQTYHLRSSEHPSFARLPIFSLIFTYKFSESAKWFAKNNLIFLPLRWIHTHNYATSGRTL